MKLSSDSGQGEDTLIMVTSGDVLLTVKPWAYSMLMGCDKAELVTVSFLVCLQEQMYRRIGKSRALFKRL